MFISFGFSPLKLKFAGKYEHINFKIYLNLIITNITLLQLCECEINQVQQVVVVL
jgi:hypothetical protein